MTSIFHQNKHGKTARFPIIQQSRILTLISPFAAGGGFNLIPVAAAGHYTFSLLLFIFLARMLTTLLCFCSGAPGGIFAPMLALGTLLGTAFGVGAMTLLPEDGPHAGSFAIAGMGAAVRRFGARAFDRDRASAGNDG